jgi:tRNA (mo5U34)-methyltransferase
MAETAPIGQADPASARDRVAANPLWYHTIDVAPGVATPGWFDLRPIVDRIPWPDVRGKRCLDVATYDGFLAFELERRGASEVVATDISDHASWDWPARIRARGPESLALLAGPEKGLGFRIAKELLGSAVERVEVNTYDLDPETLGSFDVVVCGSLMLHLRDPIAALEAIRTVCAGKFLSIEEIDLQLTLRHPRRAVARLDGVSPLCQWWIANAVAHRRMLESAGFDVVSSTRPFCEPLGEGHPPPRGMRSQVRNAMTRAVARGTGVFSAAALAVPADLT